jgi:hypothetical protein
MSISYDYFFNSDSGLHQLTSQINEWIGCNLTIQESERGRDQAWCRFFGMSLDFKSRTLHNDGLVDFESYKYQIGFVGPGDVRSMALPLIATMAYLLFCRLDISDGTIVYDIQVPLSRYERRSSEGYEDLFDIVSNRFVEFPRHFLDLQSKIS